MREGIRMKKLLWLSILLSITAHADDGCIWLPDLPGCATGTLVGPSQALDVNVVQSTPITFASSIPVTGTVTANQGAPGATASPWPVAIASSIPVTVYQGTPAALTIHQAVILAGTTAMRLTYNGNAPASTRVLLVFQLSTAATNICFVGSSSVTTSNGAVISPGEKLALTNDAGDYYVICAGMFQAVYILEQE
jgi:hypothetical protein